MALDGILVQLVGLVLRVVKLLSWYELHHLNVIFTTNTCGVYWTSENSRRYFFLNESHPFYVV